MKRNKYIFLIILTFILACEEQVDMGYNEQPIPLVYCIFDNQDTIHHVVLTKTVCGYEDTRKMAKIFDSLFYNAAEVYFEYDWFNSSKRIYLEKKLFFDKNPGYFSNPDHVVYQTSESIPETVEKIGLFIDIPGLEIAFSTIDIVLIRNHELISPAGSGATINIDTVAPWKIRLDRFFKWNSYIEANIEIDIIEKNISGIEKVKTIYFYKNRFSESNDPKYIEIPIDMLINELMSGIENDPNVIWRKFGHIRLKLYQGDEYFEKYLKSLDSFNDFALTSNYTNITNGVGIFSSRSCLFRDKLQFKSYSLKQLLEDPRIRKMKIIG